MSTTITLPNPCLVVLMGASGAGKSTFAARHFAPHAVISSDWARGFVSDDENRQDVNREAFALVHHLIGVRLGNMCTAVVDATNVQQGARAPLLKLAREHDLMAVAIVLDTPEKVCVERNAARPLRNFGKRVVAGHRRQLRQSLRKLRKEGFRQVHVLDAQAQQDVQILIEPLHASRTRAQTGPFDIIGDVHGCADELQTLLERLGYGITWEGDRSAAPHFGVRVSAPEGRRAIFLGDLVDRGPKTPDVLRLAMSMVADGVALAVPGNHDVKLVRALKGRRVQLNHGLDRSMAQLEAESEGFKQAVVGFIEPLTSHLILDEGQLCVAHAGMNSAYMGRASRRVRDFALYGQTTGAKDKRGLPIREDWAADYRGKATVVYGHTPVSEPRWVNNTVCLDTACVFGGKLTALRYPERELVQVAAAEVYCQSEHTPELQQAPEDPRWHHLLEIDGVEGRRTLMTRLRPTITIDAPRSAAALEVMSRFAVDPRWLIHLPPTMAPCEATKEGQFLEHPQQALESFRRWGQRKVVAQVKHMGSRAIVVVCKDAQSARERFGVEDGRTGRIYTRTGRAFFKDDALEAALIARVAAQAERTGVFEALATDWLCLDAELMPWSLKAGALLREQYAATGSAAHHSLKAARQALERATSRGMDVEALLSGVVRRQGQAQAFTKAWRGYCWEVEGLEGVRLAPFHLLAAEGEVFAGRDHRWHMEILDRLCQGDPLLFTTEHHVVELEDPEACRALCERWEALTAAGGEGMVIKPLDYVSRDKKGGLVQPALKCRGRDYLRIIYGLGYDDPSSLSQLRTRRTGKKRSLALREFALGVEALERFVRREPLRKVHECVFGVLALESEPVDPRL